MKKLLSLLIGGLLCYSTVCGQRNLEVVADINSHPHTIILDDKMIIASNNEDFLRIYNDATLSSVSFPVVAGVRLKYHSIRKPTLFHGQLYLTLWNESTPFLFRFNGTIFSPVSIPGAIVTSCVTFGDLLYFLSDDAGIIKLFSHNGTVTTAVPSATIPLTRSYDLKAAGNFLYLIGQGYYTSEPYTIKRYNGSVVTTLPSFTFFNGIDQIIPVTGTNRAYFLVGGYRLLYYNGSTITTIHDVEGGTISAEYTGTVLYFVATIDPEPGPQYLYRVEGATVFPISLPPGARLFVHTKILWHGTHLYIPVTYGLTNNKVLRYNGTAFTDFFTVPGERRSYTALHVREGRLLIQPEVAHGSQAWEYDGLTFTEIIAPAGYHLATPLGSTTCHHLWLDLHSEAGTGRTLNALLAESKGCPVPVIPGSAQQFETIDIGMLTNGRGWCWNEIIVDWKIVPICLTPPCPLPVFALTFTDLKNNIAWQSTFDKPFRAQVPLKDDQPYKTVMTVSYEKIPQDLFIFQDNLVPKGIKSINLYMKPGEGYFKLASETASGKQVPLKVELLDKEGKTLWEKTFIAPFTTEIKDKVEKPGQTLRFSVPDNLLVSIIPVNKLPGN